ncbi:VirB4 family type IV secretion/conjugal transfer ATPase [Ehrlichia muris]|uniref:VirB4 family type IV secretion/conjugal transfer ATPase n=1 Tax=Ehrlichia muris TaxID=35795 RepID=UPI0037C0CEC4
MSFFQEIIDRSSNLNPNNVSIKRRDNTGNFIPSACHYDESTILNKDGELVQILKIEDYVVSHYINDKDLRAAVRNSIINSIKVPEVSFWIYTVRKPHKFDFVRRNINDISDVLSDAHLNNIGQRATYINELYIAVVTSCLPETMKGVFGALSFSYIKNKHKDFLKKRIIRLNKVTENILENLKKFEARKLGLIVVDKEKVRSELVEFLYYLTMMHHKECFLDMADLSGICSDCNIEMGFNTFKVSYNNYQRFGAILAIKDYKDSPLDALDQCLQQDYEFIIVEIIRFTKSKDALKLFQKQAMCLEFSNDARLRKISNIDNFVSVDADSWLSFCERKISFVITSNTLPQLHSNVDKTVASLASLGIICVRCDLTLEDDFWAHLPGNFAYVLNLRYTLIKYACAFSLLHYFPSGALQGNKWGQAVTMFFSNKGKPYFFSFHVLGAGHTLMVGSLQSSVTMLLNFLLSESRRLNTRIVLLDYTGKSIIFVKAIGGQYYRADHRRDYQEMSFNLFQLEDSVLNRKIVLGVLRRMLNVKDINEEMSNAIDKVVDYLFTLPIESRTISNISDHISALGKNASQWVNNGEFAHLLKEDANIDWKAEVLGLNVGVLCSKPQCASVLIFYFLNTLINYFDGSPTILVIDEAWILDYVFTNKQEFDEWIEMMNKLNVVVVFAGENIPAIISSNVIYQFNEHVETQIFMPNSVSTSKMYMKAFNLSKSECKTMFQMPSQEGYFFVKQDNNPAVLSFNLPDIPESHVLSANKNTIRYMYESIHTHGDDVKEWLPAFYKKCSV